MKPTDEPGRVRAAVVGAGLMGSWHAWAAQRAGGRVVAVVDPCPRRAQALAARFPGAMTDDDLERAVEARAVDVVHLCAPSATHPILTSKALRKGAHVLVEKPLAPTAEITAELLDLAASKGRLLCPTHQFLYQPAVRGLLRDLTSLGSLVHADALICSAGAESRSDQDRDRIAGEILPHPLSLFARVFPGELSAARWEARHPSPGEIRVFGQVGPVSVSVLVSMAGRPTANELHLIGQSATATLDLFHGFRVIDSGAVSRFSKGARPFRRSAQILLAASLNLVERAARRELAYPGLGELVRQFYGAVRNGQPSPISADETLAVARTRDLWLHDLGLDS